MPIGFFQLTTEVAPGGGTKVTAFQNPDGSFSQIVSLMSASHVALTYDPVTQDMTKAVLTYPGGTTKTYNLTYDSYSNLIDVAVS